MTRWGWGAVAWAATAMPAVASTMPGTDMPRGQVRLTGGAGAIAADYAPLDRWSLGAMASFVPLTFQSASVWYGHAGLRVGYRLVEAGNVSVGVVMSGGLTEAVDGGDFVGIRRRVSGWVQPALSGAVSWPVWIQGARLHLRATLGPSFSFDPAQAGVYTFPLLPNAEVALSFPASTRTGVIPGMAPFPVREPAHEVVIGGGSILAYRWLL
ncbi:MAG: hypothetical protein ACK46X_04910 [Candidatus Sericytochromatia bacterium]